MKPLAKVGLIVSGCLPAVLVVATLLAGCGNSFEQAKIRGSNIASMMAIKDVAIALERYRLAHGSYPSAATMAELRKSAAPLLDRASGTDRWGEALVVDVTAGGYTLSSKGDDQMGSHEFGGPVTAPGHSITMKNGLFVQYDASVERSARDLEAEIAKDRSSGEKP